MYFCMNNSVAYMSDSFEAKKNTQASMITLGVAGLILLIFIMIKMDFPTFELPIVDNAVEVNLNIPEEIAPTIGGGGGGGGGNPVQATGPAGTAYSPPQPGEKEDVKDIEDNKDKESPAILKPDNAKPRATKINSNQSVVKTDPKPIVETPTPPKPKAVLGKTVGGAGTGGGVADNYDRAGGKGNGSGVGNGDGISGGNGNGAGGGNGTGNGLGTGPKNFGTKVLNIANQSFEDEFNENAKVAMDIVADERGRVLSATFQPRGSTTSNRKLIDIAERRAFELKLGTSGGGQKGTVIFNFKLRG
jgi:hypothetical protein